MNYRRPNYSFDSLPQWAQGYIHQLELKVDNKTAAINKMRAVEDGDEDTTTTIEGSIWAGTETVHLPSNETITFFGRERGGFDVRPVRDHEGNNHHLIINSYLGNLYVSPQAGNVVKIFSERT